MAATPSSMLALGTAAPGFTLPDVHTGRPVSLDDFAGQEALLVMFVCAHCPYVVHVQSELARLAADYVPRHVAFVAITANDIARYPQDAPEASAAMAREAGWRFPFLYDATQEVAKAYSAACTPDFFLFDKARQLVYRGQLDKTRPSTGTPDGADLRAALDAILSGHPVDPQQKPSIGCSIKWKPGSEPR